MNGSIGGKKLADNMYLTIKTREDWDKDMQKMKQHQFIHSAKLTS